MNFDIHVFQTRKGLYKARITYSKGKMEYVGPARNIGLLLKDVQRHILIGERD